MNHSAVAAAEKRKSRIYTMTTTAVMTAVICVLAPLSVPIGPVPISLTNLAIYLALYLLGWKLGTLSYIVYLLLGLCGAPVFAGFTGGAARLLGPTGGYIVGFIPMAVLGGLVIDHCANRVLHFAGLAAGTLICYVFGTAWFCFVAQMAVIPALSLAVFPFIPFDIGKIVLTILAGPVLRERLVSAGLLSTEKHL